MKHAALFKKILAFTLAALIGLSALSTLFVAFAAEEPSKPEKKFDYEYELETTEDSIVPVEEGDDFALVVPEASVTQLKLGFDDTAAFSVELGNTRELWVGWSTEYTENIWTLMDRYGVALDVLDFTFSPAFENEGTMTYTTQNPYLYRLEGKNLVPVTTSYADGVHTFQASVLGCFIAASEKLPL